MRLSFRLEKTHLQCYTQQLCRRKSDGPGVCLYLYRGPLDDDKDFTVQIFL